MPYDDGKIVSFKEMADNLKFVPCIETFGDGKVRFVTPGEYFRLWIKDEVR